MLSETRCRMEDTPVKGGTGRFKDASGSFGPVTITADLTPTGCTFSYSAMGTITY